MLLVKIDNMEEDVFLWFFLERENCELLKIIEFKFGYLIFNVFWLEMKV